MTDVVTDYYRDLDHGRRMAQRMLQEWYARGYEQDETKEDNE